MSFRGFLAAKVKGQQKKTVIQGMNFPFFFSTITELNVTVLLLFDIYIFYNAISRSFVGNPVNEKSSPGLERSVRSREREGEREFRPRPWKEERKREEDTMMIRLLFDGGGRRRRNKLNASYRRLRVGNEFSFFPLLLLSL